VFGGKRKLDVREGEGEGEGRGRGEREKGRGEREEGRGEVYPETSVISFL
jgi:hypothetical protein